MTLDKLGVCFDCLVCLVLAIASRMMGTMFDLRVRSRGADDAPC